MKIHIALALLGALCTTAAPTQKHHFRFLGVDESGAEFGGQNLPGTLGKDYTWPSTTSINTLIGDGFNIFRVPFLMERLVPSQMTGKPDTTYLAGLRNVVHDITTKGGHAIIDPHNFGRYYGNIITNPASFQTFWHTVASEFAGNPNVIFDTNNEYHDMDQTLVLHLNQAAINGIRAAGAKKQMIFAEGNSYTGAWTWTQVNDNLKELKDPENRLVYEMHQYLDSDGSGTSDQCVSSSIGQQRVESATQWLVKNNKRGFLGEFAGGANAVCKSAVTGMLSYMAKYPNHWLGACWWGGGPWWGDYIYAFEPPSSTAYNYYLSTLEAAR